MKKTVYLFLILFTAFVVKSNAQTLSSEEDLLSSQELAQDRVIKNNAIQSNPVLNIATNPNVIQNGDNNNVNVSQAGGSVSNSNLVNIMQSGNLNGITLDQNGNNNASQIAQFGDNNEYNGLVNGDRNFSGINQFGNNNTINQKLTGNDLNYRLIQQGNNNEINQIENGMGNLGNAYEIRQQGNGMNITIKNGF